MDTWGLDCEVSLEKLLAPGCSCCARAPVSFTAVSGQDSHCRSQPLFTFLQRPDHSLGSESIFSTD